MTAEGDVHGEVSEVLKGEIEEKCGLDMSSYEDLPKGGGGGGGGGECNGVLHDDEVEEEDGIIRNGTDDADGSYVFVNGSDAAAAAAAAAATAADDPIDGDLNAKLSVPESPSEKIEVQVVEEIKVKSGENVQSRVEEDNCIDEGTFVAPALSDVVVESVENVRSESVEEGRSESVDRDVKGEEQINLESSRELEASQESQVMVLEEVAAEFSQFDDGIVKNVEQNTADSVAEVDESQASQIATTKSSELEINDGENGEVEAEVEGESKSDSAIDLKENGEPQNMVSEGVQLELAQKKEAEELANEIPAEGCPGMDMESDWEIATCPVTDIQLETEVANGSARDENDSATDENDSATDENGVSLPNSHVEYGAPETAVINELPDGSQKPPELDESFENAESLPLPADCVRSEIEVGNVLFESGESSHSAPQNDSVTEAENGTEASLIAENSPSSAIDDVRSATEVEKSDAKSGESGISSPADNTKSETEVVNLPIEGDAPSRSDIEVSNGPVECDGTSGSEIEVSNGPIEGDGTSSCPADNVRAEPEISIDAINCEEVSTPPHEDVNVECDVSNRIVESTCHQPIPVDDLDPENDSVENDSSLPNCHVKSESDAENASALCSRDISTNDATTSESEVPNGSVVDSGSAPRCYADIVDFGKEGDQSTAGDGDAKQVCQENEQIEEIDRDDTATSSPEEPKANALDGQNVVTTEVEKRPFHFLIRIPRYDDENLRGQIKHAQLQVDEKTQIRDAIRGEILTKKATCMKYGNNVESARSEERNSRDMLKSKRQEIDSVQSVINRVKNAISVEDIDSRIRNMEHMIEHETLPLKEEKQIIREIKQMKQLREQLSSSMGREDEVQQALDQRDQIEERSKSLKKEADLLRDNVLKAEAVTKAAKKEYYEESGKLNELQAKFKAADDVRQEAYAHLQNLRKQLSEKNKHFRMYKDDEKAAKDYALNGDREALQRLCVNQVETIMELWNKNDEFRKEYVRCNMRSTLRRLRTLDGRSLGPDEEPPAVPNFVSGRVDKSLYAPAKGESMSLSSTLQQEKLVVPAEDEKADDKSVAKVVEQKNQTAKTKKPTKTAPLGYGTATVSGREETEDAKEEEHKQTKVEEELARKAEELRKEEAAAKLKELRRLEEKAKAKEALERKKRNIDKAQAKAELRAQKEAEQKEKEREKKARKKERKKAVEAEATNVMTDGDSTPSSEAATETMKESETREKPLAMTNRPKKSSQFAKQNKAKSIPLPLRNRVKRRMQPWMWFLVTALLVLVLFLIGNGGFSFNLGLRRFGF